ncbi:MAG: DUF1905 domain-containing protein [Oceanospirillaceae bacterium]|nr:DUF1905 domain-containing protein [Oceanospirillaceae bacterium]
MYSNSVERLDTKFIRQSILVFFLTLPLPVAEHVRFLFPRRRGFGSIPVKVQIVASQWKTSIYPNKKSAHSFYRSRLLSAQLGVLARATWLRFA